MKGALEHGLANPPPTAGGDRALLPRARGLLSEFGLAHFFEAKLLTMVVLARKILEANKIEGAVLIVRIATGSVPDFLTGTGVPLVVEDEPNLAAFGLGFLAGC